jgi:hypothetical protein
MLIEMNILKMYLKVIYCELNKIVFCTLQTAFKSRKLPESGQNKQQWPS